jgi:hypothetical protein
VRVEIRHEVDWVPGQSYNFLVYDFITADSRVRARAYLHTMSHVTLLGRLLPDGRLPVPTPAVPFDPEAMKSGDALAALEAMDPTKAAEFDQVLDYLRERYSEVRVSGVGGNRKLADGLSPEEQNIRMNQGTSTVTDTAIIRSGQKQ